MIKGSAILSTTLEDFSITEVSVVDWLAFYNNEPAYFFGLFEEPATNKETQKHRDYYLDEYGAMDDIYANEVTHLGDNRYSLDGRGVSGAMIVMIINSRE